MSERGFRKRSVLVGLLVCLAAGGFLLWRFVISPPKPTFERAGGTILTCEIDPDVLAKRGGDAEAAARAVREAIDPEGTAGVEVRPSGANRLEVRVPHQGEFHEEAVRLVKWILGSAGSFELRILANWHDDKEAMEVACEYFEKRAEDWRAVVAEVAQQWPGNRKDHYDGIDFGDDADLVARARQAAPGTADADVRRFVAACRARRPKLAELARRAEAGEPPPPPEASRPDEGFPLPHEGGRGAFYSWALISRSERESLRLVEDAPDSGPWAAAEQARRLGEPFSEYRSAKRDVTEPVMGDFNAPGLLYSRRAGQGRLGSEIFVLTRHTEKGKEITGADVISAREGEPPARLTRAIDFRLSTDGGERLYALSTMNQPDRAAHFRRHLAILVDGAVFSAPSLSAPVRAQGQINGRFSNEETHYLLALLRAAPLGDLLRPELLKEEFVGPAGR